MSERKPLSDGQLASVIALCQQAGAAIMGIYRVSAEPHAWIKQDDSPVTAADHAAHDVLVAGLDVIWPLPVLSEEGEMVPFDKRRQWQRYWLVDPLDGTKEFLEKSGEFTVNVALIERHRPLFGVVHLPVSATTYWGDLRDPHGPAAWIDDRLGRRPIHTRELAPRLRAGLDLEVVSSRRHGAAEAETMLSQIDSDIPGFKTLSLGSSIKLCRVAEGAADLYPRLVPTSEWDTAAGQAVVEGAGGAVLDRAGRALEYNRKASILNEDFFVIGDTNFDWRTLLNIGLPSH